MRGDGGGEGGKRDGDGLGEGGRTGCGLGDGGGDGRIGGFGGGGTGSPKNVKPPAGRVILALDADVSASRHSKVRRSCMGSRV